jgi:hypothetical protein
VAMRMMLLKVWAGPKGLENPNGFKEVLMIK